MFDLERGSCVLDLEFRGLWMGWVVRLEPLRLRDLRWGRGISGFTNRFASLWFLRNHSRFQGVAQTMGNDINWTWHQWLECQSSKHFHTGKLFLFCFSQTQVARCLSRNSSDKSTRLTRPVLSDVLGVRVFPHANSMRPSNRTVKPRRWSIERSWSRHGSRIRLYRQRFMIVYVFPKSHGVAQVFWKSGHEYHLFFFKAVVTRGSPSLEIFGEIIPLSATICELELSFAPAACLTLGILSSQYS